MNYKIEKLKMSYNIEKIKEKFMLWFVWKLPKQLVYWCAIRLGAHATTGEYGHLETPKLSFLDALNRWPPTPQDGER